MCLAIATSFGFSRLRPSERFANIYMMHGEHSMIAIVRMPGKYACTMQMHAFISH